MLPQNVYTLHARVTRKQGSMCNYIGIVPRAFVEKSGGAPIEHAMIVGGWGLHDAATYGIRYQNAGGACLSVGTSNGTYTHAHTLS